MTILPAQQGDMLEIRTFGTLLFRDTVADVDLHSILSRPKRAALLAYLASARPPGLRRRDELFAIFWPDLPQRNARKALNQSVYVLRSAIGPKVIVSRRGEEVGLDPDAVWCDAVAFEDALARGDRRAALDLYVDEFLMAFHMPGSLAFERWLDAERDRYGRLALDTATGLADAEAGAGNIPQAVDHVRWALERSPYDEALIGRLLRLLADQGDSVSATRELERFAARLEADVGVEVSRETQALVERVAQSRPPRPVGSAEIPPSSPTASPVPVEPDTRAPVEHGPARALQLRNAAGIAITAGVIAAIALFSAGRSDGAANVALPEPARVLVAPLENLTGSTELDPLGRIAADWVARGLLRTGLVGVVPAGLPLDSDPATTVADAEADLAFSGAFHREAGRLVIEAGIMDADSRTVVRSLEPIDADESDPLAALERLRQRATGALATLVDPRFADWADDASQPPSFETYLEYVDGMERLERGDYLGAGDRFLAAAARDSSFTSALLWAIQSYGLVGDGPRDSLALALEPERDGLPAWDRAMLDFHLADLRHDNRGAYEAMRRIVRLSPTAQWRVLLAQQARRINRPVEALRLIRGIEPEQVTGIPPSLYWIVLGNTYHTLDMFEEERATALKWSIGIPGAGLRLELNALAGLGRGDEVVRRVLELSREWTWTYERAELLRRVALELRAHGQPQQARAVLDRSFTLYELADDSVRQDPESRFVIGRSLYAADRWPESRALFERLLAENYRTHVVRGDIGIAAARLGDRETARAMIEWYTRWARENPRHGGWGTQWRARIAAAMRDRDAAVRWLRQALDEGWSFTVWDHRTEEYENLDGYGPFEELMRPAG